MTTGSDKGFTIIEVMLFLAITGVLFATLILGVGSNIFRQNYLNAVRSYEALLQGEYAEAVSTKQEVDATLKECASGAVPMTGGLTRSSGRGTTQCIILGRLIQVNPGGASVTVSSVTGQDISSSSGNLGDIDALLASEPKETLIGKRTIELDAGITLRTTTAPRADSTAVVLIVRSPLSGLVHIFASDSMPSPRTPAASVKGLIAPAFRTAVVENCLEGSFGMPTQIVKIDARIAGVDAFTTQEPSAGQCS